MAVLTVQELGSHAAVEPTFSAADALGDEFDNDGDTVVLVKGAAVPTGTITANGVTDSNKRTGNTTLAPSATTTGIMGKFPRDLYNQSGRVKLTYSDVVDISIAVVRFVN